MEKLTSAQIERLQAQQDWKDGKVTEFTNQPMAQEKRFMRREYINKFLHGGIFSLSEIKKGVRFYELR